MEKLNYIVDSLYHSQATLSKEDLHEVGIPESMADKIVEIKGSLEAFDQLNTKEMKRVNKQLQDSRDDTFKVIKDLKDSLKDVLTESKNSQFITKAMFVITFLLGLLLIGYAVYFGIQGQQVLAITFGTFGMGSIVAYLIADPPLKMQDSRSNYAQLTVGILAWFNDFIDKSGMHVLNNQINAALLNTKIDIASKLHVQQEGLNNYMKLSEAQINNTVKLLTLIDEVAEPTNRKSMSQNNLSKPTEEKSS